MDTTAFPRQAEDERETPGALGGGTCDVLGRMNDERLHLMGLLVRSHRRLVIVLGRELEEAVGIPLLWFDVLINVGGAPEGRLTMSKLSSDISLTTGGVTRLVDRMAEAGLVARENCPSDRRSVFVVLTTSGRAMLDQAIVQHIDGIDRHLITPLDEADRTALARALTKLADGGC
jgi:MarR family transcriptional regulator, 2-MHQ and catechol-resistance regulon repressor